MSLAEELLADLDDGDDVENYHMEESDIPEAVEEVFEAQKKVGLYSKITDVAKLSASIEYRQSVEQMNELMKLPEIPAFTTPLETDAQYVLVVKLSELAIEIEQEITVIHKFVRDKYEKRFPELETLVQMPLDYMATVKLLGNDIALRAQNKDLLADVLPASACIILSVTASTTQGVPLTEDELQVVMEACEMAERIQSDRMFIHQFVEERMTLIAPNLCKILGSGTAAMIVSQAGGLGPLAKQPACNIQVLGKKKKTLAGFSTAAVNPHSGFIYYHPLVQRLPPDHRQKASKIIAAKCALASRVDSLHQSPDGAIGDQLAAEIKRRIDKLLEPPSVKFQKPLPKPLDKASKKRGGRRVRKQKELMGATEMRKKANRMNFAEIEEDVRQDAIGFSLGQMKSQTANGGGRLRTVVDNKNKHKMSQKQLKTLQRRQHGGLTSLKTSNANGTMSSVSFTPVQGVEIISMTPIDTKASVSGGTSSYFSSTSNFRKVQMPIHK
uniref:U4/U6 small nuclear ribonucleoprotein Prp31 n=1 Tax=Bursaphelenchus xylophilus TaxID=6326 RepID=A0A1I7S7D5_BURXY